MAQRSAHPKAMVKDSYRYFMESYDGEDKTFSQIVQQEASSAAYEQYTSAIGPAGLTKVREGNSIPRQSTQEGYTVYCANYKYPAELPLTNEALDDNQKIANFLKAWASGLGEAIANKQNSDHADIFNYGGYTAGHDTFNNNIPGVISPGYGDLIYDGKPFFALSGNNHTAKNGSTFYNSVASLTLNGQNLEDLMKLIAVTNAFSEAGQEVSIKPDTLLVQYGSSNYYKAQRLLESMADEDAAHSGVTNVWRNSLKLIGWRFLTDKNVVRYIRDGIDKIALNCGKLLRVLDTFMVKMLRIGQSAANQLKLAVQRLHGQPQLNWVMI